MEYRIEQLARASGVAVDTVRFYQGKKLLPSPRREGRVTWYGEDHLDRLLRIRALQERGFTLTVIRRFLSGELEPSDEGLVAAVTSPASTELLSLEQLATRAGTPTALLEAAEQVGLLVPATGEGAERRYPASELDALRAGMKLLEAGIPLNDLLVLAKEQADATERSAHRAVDLFDRYVRERLQAEAGDRDISKVLVRRFDTLLDAGTTLLVHHFRRTLMLAAEAHIERGARGE